MKQQWTSQVWGAALLVAATAGCSTAADGMMAGGTNATAAAGSNSATAGAGPAAAGAAAGAGASAAVTGPFACGPKSAKAPAELYAAMAGAFLPKDMMNSMLPCAFGSCHNMGKKAAQLELPLGGDLIALLVSKPSCEVPTMNLVEPGGGDDALKKSWFWYKLAAPTDGSGNLTVDPAWGTPGSCGQMSEFGMRMPYSSGTEGVGDAKLAIAREWICAGAPGPNG